MISFTSAWFRQTETYVSKFHSDVSLMSCLIVLKRNYQSLWSNYVNLYLPFYQNINLEGQTLLYKEIIVLLAVLIAQRLLVFLYIYIFIVEFYI